MGKGSKRRLPRISSEKFAENWDRIFDKTRKFAEWEHNNPPGQDNKEHRDDKPSGTKPSSDG